MPDSPAAQAATSQPSAQATQAARAVAPSRSSAGELSSLVLLAVLLAAALILNMTVGNALAMAGIKPQFIIAAYALTILLTRASFGRAALYAVIAAAVTQLSTSVPGANFVSEPLAALVMVAIVRLRPTLAGRDLAPTVATFVATIVSGGVFALLGTVLSGAALPTALVKLPMVLSVAVFNTVFVQATFPLLKKALNR